MHRGSTGSGCNKLTMIMLKETLLDDEHRTLDIADEITLHEDVRRLQDNHLAESSKKDMQGRLAAQEHRDLITLALVLYTCAIVLCIVSSNMSFLATSSRAVELMFALSVVMGPTVLYRRSSLSYDRLQREFIGEMWDRIENLKLKNDDLKHWQRTQDILARPRLWTVYDNLEKASLRSA
eukprot:scaffold10854_cov155-Skeletonema_dohrnii-CCMP3373.AAC.15